MFDMAGPMSLGGKDPALAFRYDVVIVELSARDMTATEVARHTSPPPV